jgi:uncharacterized cupin superfamily protein
MSWKLQLASVLGVLAATPYARALRRPVTVSGLDALELVDAPIEPSWILAGNPVARSAVHSRSDDDSATTSVWECTAGSFRWHFGWEETVLILEGSVRVTGEDGSVQVLKAGDIGYFAGGTWATWEIDDYVRKLAFCRRMIPPSMMLALKMKTAVRELVFGGKAA